ncbi:hypothetical protein [Nocardia sp. NPDC006630]|uniref:hypothetical protein n=1 Tax=Nocardia sp. NPDC006630 TaxID=3157181 RepID=UPI0033AE854F
MSAHRMPASGRPESGRRRFGRFANIAWTALGILLSFTFTGIFSGTPMHRALNIAAIAACVLAGLVVWIADERREAGRAPGNDD